MKGFYGTLFVRDGNLGIERLIKKQQRAEALNRKNLDKQNLISYLLRNAQKHPEYTQRIEELRRNRHKLPYRASYLETSKYGWGW
jgi:hypothetical protein